MAATPSSSLRRAGPPGLGVGTFFQAEPFQCRIRVWKAMPLEYSPAAQTSPAEVTATLVRKLLWDALPGLGLGTRFQAVPFQCRIRVWKAVPSEYSPTAHALPAELAATPRSWLVRVGPPGSGLGTCFHAVPFQCRIR